MLSDSLPPLLAQVWWYVMLDWIIAIAFIVVIAAATLALDRGSELNELFHSREYTRYRVFSDTGVFVAATNDKELANKFAQYYKGSVFDSWES